MAAPRFDPCLILSLNCTMLRPTSRKHLFRARACRPIAMLTIGSMCEIANITSHAAAKICRITHPTSMAHLREWRSHNLTLRQGWMGEVLTAYGMAASGIWIGREYSKVVLRRTLWLYPLIKRGTQWLAAESDSPRPGAMLQMAADSHGIAVWLERLDALVGKLDESTDSDLTAGEPPV